MKFHEVSEPELAVITLWSKGARSRSNGTIRPPVIEEVADMNARPALGLPWEFSYTWLGSKLGELESFVRSRRETLGDIGRHKQRVLCWKGLE